MRQLQIKKGHHASRARRDQECEQILPLDPRDPDIARARQLQTASRSRGRDASSGGQT
jgi:hypothetical protein